MNQKLAEARILAARKMPYMTHQVMTLIPVERPGLGTMAVDEYCRLYFDPAFLEEPRPEALGVRGVARGDPRLEPPRQAGRAPAGRETGQ